MEAGREGGPAQALNDQGPLSYGNDERIRKEPLEVGQTTRTLKEMLKI